jgi:hypothetical protein
VHVLHCISEKALSPLVESRLVLYEEWWTEKGKLIFLIPRPAAIYIDLGATSDISPHIAHWKRGSAAISTNSGSDPAALPT